MASKRFIKTAQADYSAANEAGDIDAAERAFRALKLALSGEPDGFCRWHTGYEPSKTTTPRRSRSRLVAEMTPEQLRKYAPASYIDQAKEEDAA